MSQRPSVLFFSVLAALFVSIVLSGCDLSIEDKAEGRKDARLKIATEPAKAKSVKVPGKWPKQIPMYPHAEVIEASTTAGGIKLTLKTGDSADKIFTWYYDTLLEGNWNMKGPTLDVAQNIAIIKSELEDISFVIDARRFRNDKGESQGSQITLTAPAPKFGY